MGYLHNPAALVSEWWDMVTSRVGLLPIFLASLSWVSAGIGAFIVYARDPQYEGHRSFRGFLRFCFPKHIMLHPSAKNDYMWAIIHKVTYPFVIGPAIFAAVALGHWSMGLAERWFGPPVHGGENWWLSFAFTMVGLVLMHDFWVFSFHRLEHKVWWIWEFHKTHHAAQAMPWGLTTRRNHPVNEFLQTFGITCIPGIVFGFFAFFVNADVDEVMFAGISVFYAIQLLSFYHLKHSHIHLRFGPLMERILVSPAQHQLHHSLREDHYGRNIGTLFAWWDMLYGSWMRSEPKPVEIGLGDEQPQFTTLWQLYSTPFVNIWRELKRRRALRRGAVVEELATTP
jgi:sterol desaturase/sphingolipid hydroxylase (fatty acid hydroxylase superfamily)